ncbi:MAG: ComEC family competence protein [Bacteroidia bacterium]|nr:ComEC family competence protein [Bacteroidia bacterium]MDW8235341.1 ComEC/Rec2 family competence protein [Bacteroidia bacterium]
MPLWRYPFLWVAAGLSTGILLAELPLYLALIGEVLLLSLAAFFWWGLLWGRIVWSLPLFALAGWVRMQAEKWVSPADLRHFRGHLVELTGYLLEEPLPSRKTYRLLVRAEEICFFLSGQTIQPLGNLVLYVRDSSVKYLPAGTRIRTAIRLDSLTSHYWNRQGVFIRGYTPQVAVLGIARDYIWGYFLRLRQQLIQAMQRATPAHGSPLAVTQALLLGYKRGLDPETREAFMLSGTAHILAVSGMHVGLVLTLWLFLLRQLPPTWSRHSIALSMLMLVVILYGLLTGASPSAIRAVIMGSVALLAQMLYRPYLSPNALGFAVFLQLSIDPALLYHIGFQLSYSAVGGIIVFYRPLQKALPSPKKKLFWINYLRDLIAISLAAQAGTLFLSWAHFGRLPVYFLLSNLLCVPIATLLAFAAVGWLFSLPIPVLSTWVGYIPYGLAIALVKVVEWLSQLPGASLHLPPIPVGIAVGATLLTLGIGAWWFAKKQEEEKLPLVI